MNQDSHPTRAELAQYVRGDLEDAAHEAVEQHIVDCQVCCDAIQSIGLGIDGLHRLLAMETDAPVNDSPVNDSPADDRAIGSSILPATEDRNYRAPHSAASDRHDVPTEGTAETADEPVPEKIGRFVITKVLGEGAFGRVYLAHDSRMDRRVALKVPKQKFFSSGKSIELFLQEARSAAKLTHPSLVTVHDVQTEGQRPYLVQEYIAGCNLEEWIARHRPNLIESVRIVRTVAEALSVVHQHNLVHRDLKPANILVDADGVPHVADFGLAIHADVLRRHMGEVSGTPRYMSPEQVRGETNRIDGRTDIWSLGIILYEMLASESPFMRPTRKAVFHAIQYDAPWPPSQLNPRIPRALECICMRCLEKLISERFTSMAGLIDDLENWSTEFEAPDATPSPRPATSSHVSRHDTSVSKDSDARATLGKTLGTTKPLLVVPRGLRSYGSDDADFYLEILPGIPNRDGLPPSVEFWKSRIENSRDKEPFSVGVMYGPSGCGKSSLVKAGVIPRLSADVTVAYVEATPEDTELRLQKRLRGSSERTRSESDLPDVIRTLRERRSDQKILIVLDQFEQWLNAKGDDPEQPLLRALRHCDGDNVQALLLLRDDFWMSITRFFRLLDIPLHDGVNCAAVDLFPLAHAQRVLTMFGRAYDRLGNGELSPEQSAMIKGSVESLADDQKVVPVRLALFAEMMKEKAWTRATLKQLGGTEGVGVEYLRASFSASSAPASHRQHQQAIRNVLAALLPEPGRDIRLRMTPYADLLKAARYENRQPDFDQLLDVLDRGTRLITLTSPEGSVVHDDVKQSGAASVDENYYQLTHDYLVPSIRTWLTRQKQATRRGRAALRLAERTELWRHKPDLLPSAWEYWNMRALTRRRDWTDAQQAMMSKAGRIQIVRGLILMTMLGAAVFGFRRIQWNSRYEEVATAFAVARPDELLGIVAQFKSLGPKALQRLAPELETSPRTTRDRISQLHARVAFAETDRSQVEQLKHELLRADAAYLQPITKVLEPYKDEFIPDLWAKLNDLSTNSGKRFRAALALANYDPKSKYWTDRHDNFVVTHLVSSNPDVQSVFRAELRPIANRLRTPLFQQFIDNEQPESQVKAANAANALLDFYGNDQQLIGQLICEANPAQHALLRPTVASSTEAAAVWKSYVDNAAPNDLEFPDDEITIGKRRAKAAINLILSGLPLDAVKAFHDSRDVETISQFVHYCKALQVRPRQLIDIMRLPSLESHAKITILYALGEFSREELSPGVSVDETEQIIREFNGMFAEAKASGIHSTVGWLLRQWQVDADLPLVRRAYDRTDEFEWFTQSFRKNAEADFTFVIFRPDADATPPSQEIGESEKPAALIDLPFAISDREVTIAQWTEFRDSPKKKFQKYPQLYEPLRRPTTAHPAAGADWFTAIEYCRWLTLELGMNDDDQCYPDPRGYTKLDLKQIFAGTKDWPCDISKRGIRLPLEAEWEHACRSGTNTTFSFGSDRELAGGYALFFDNSQEVSHPCGSRKPNFRGLFDMHGNLLEWCQDSGNQDDPDFRTLKIQRGGSHNNRLRNLGSAFKVRSDVSWRRRHCGFRVARSLP